MDMGMPMSFAWGWNTVLWFPGWRAASPAGFAALVLAIGAVATAHEALGAYRGRLLRRQLGAGGGRPAASPRHEPLLGGSGSGSSAARAEPPADAAPARRARALSRRALRSNNTPSNPA
jgi:hypothetical protein